MTELTERYLDACKNRDAAYEAVIEACEHVVLLADILRSTPGNVQIVGIPHAVGTVAATLSFNASQWPTAADINNSLMGFHAALGKVQSAWLNVQAHGEQQGLAPPPADPWEAMRKELLNRAGRRPR